MVALGRTSNRSFDDAMQVVSAAAAGRSLQYRGEHADLIPIIAAAATVLERGAPNLIFDSYDTKANDYLRQGSKPWRMLHNSLAYEMNQDIIDPDRSPSNETQIAGIVHGVMLQGKANRICLALNNSDMISRLTPDQGYLFADAVNDDSLAKDLKLISYASFADVSPANQSLISHGIMADGLAPEMRQHIAGVMAPLGNLTERMADDRFKSVNDQGFSPVSQESLNRRDAFISSGISTGSPDIDLALKMTSDQQSFQAGIGGAFISSDDISLRIAQSRLIEETELLVGMPAASMVDRVKTDWDIMYWAEVQNDIYPSDMMQDKARGDYHKLPEIERIGVARDMANFSSITPMAQFSHDVRALDLGATLSQERVISVESQEAGKPRTSAIAAAQFHRQMGI